MLIDGNSRIGFGDSGSEGSRGEVVTRIAAGASLGAVALAVLLAASAGVQSCAHVGAPAGGPPDSTPPLLVLVEPDSFSVMSEFRGNRGEVRFEFDEPISERNINGAAMVYPFDLRPHARKGKRDLRVRPRVGWIEDRIYHIRIEPVIQDLFGNRIPEPILYTISTGMPITQNAVTGTVYDRITGVKHTNSRIDLVILPDTLRYGGISDSVGDFSVSVLPAGEYYAIGYEDVNGNQRVDGFDRSDTLRVTLGSIDTLTLEFNVFHHDTLGPLLSLVEVLDSMTLSLGFDGFLDPDTPLSVQNIQVFTVQDSLPVGAPLAIDSVMHNWRFLIYRDSIELIEQARRDSVAAAEAEEAARQAAAAADSAAAADTVAVEAAAVEEPTPEPVRAGPRTLQIEEPPPDSVVVPQELPDSRIMVILAEALPPGAYVVIAVRIVNLNSLEGGGEMPFEVEEPVSEDEGDGEGPPGSSG